MKWQKSQNQSLGNKYHYMIFADPAALDCGGLFYPYPIFAVDLRLHSVKENYISYLWFWTFLRNLENVRNKQTRVVYKFGTKIKSTLLVDKLFYFRRRSRFLGLYTSTNAAQVSLLVPNNRIGPIQHSIPPL